MDSIDEMIEYEDRLVFNPVKDFHDPQCKESMRNPNDFKCCQPQIKIFNRCNKKSYIDQELELPLIIGQDKLSQHQVEADNFDIMSQFSSQFSESSKSSKCTYIGGSTSDKNQPQTPKNMTTKEQIMQIHTTGMSENMYCLEFDLTQFPLVNEQGQDIEINQKFRKIDQKFTERILHMKLSANCHG